MPGRVPGPEFLAPRLAQYREEQRSVVGADTFRPNRERLATRALMAAGPVDRVQMTLFPVTSGRTRDDPVVGGAADVDLDLIESRTLDGNAVEPVHQPSPHG